MSCPSSSTPSDATPRSRFNAGRVELIGAFKYDALALETIRLLAHLNLLADVGRGGEERLRFSRVPCCVPTKASVSAKAASPPTRLRSALGERGAPERVRDEGRYGDRLIAPSHVAPWVHSPGVHPFHIHWRMGSGEGHLALWHKWASGHEPSERIAAMRLFGPVPADWAGWAAEAGNLVADSLDFAFEEVRTMLEHAGLSVAGEPEK